jgi:DNA-binding transcriptional ArsR family regulator
LTLAVVLTLYFHVAIFIFMNLDEPADALSATFAALADPTRRAILARLSQGEATVLELAAPFALTQPTVTKHLKVLERAGLIASAKDAQRRPRRLRPERLKLVDDWLEFYRRFWEGSFDKMDDYLKQMTKGDPHGPKS